MPAAALVVAAVLAATAAPAGAQADAQAPSEYSHLGVQLRLLAAPAYLYATQEIGPANTEIEGFGALFDIALGAMISERFALNMDLVLAYSPAADHGVLEDTIFSALHVGAGFTYWLMPANLYVAASIGAARSNVENSTVRIGLEVPDNDPSYIGFGAHALFGKQFWVTRRIGLGASLSLLASIANNPIGGEDTDRIVFGAAVGLSLTLN